MTGGSVDNEAVEARLTTDAIRLASLTISYAFHAIIYVGVYSLVKQLIRIWRLEVPTADDGETKEEEEEASCGRKRLRLRRRGAGRRRNVAQLCPLSTPACVVYGDDDSDGLDDEDEMSAEPGETSCFRRHGRVSSPHRRIHYYRAAQRPNCSPQAAGNVVRSSNGEGVRTVKAI